ncbi:hypothetical protein KAR48_16500 [bacterium]|nr:hypothetical protein [bacterium]
MVNHSGKIFRTMLSALVIIFLFIQCQSQKDVSFEVLEWSSKHNPLVAKYLKNYMTAAWLNFRYILPNGISYHSKFVIAQSTGEIQSISMEGKSTRADLSPVGRIISLKTDRFEPDTLYVLKCGVPSDTIFISVDGGRKFNRIREIPKSNPETSAAFDVSPMSSRILCAAGSDSIVYVSDDAGENWQEYLLHFESFSGKADSGFGPYSSVRVLADPSDCSVFFIQASRSPGEYKTFIMNMRECQCSPAYQNYYQPISKIVGVQRIYPDYNHSPLSIVYCSDRIFRRHHFKIEVLDSVDSKMQIIGAEPEPGGFVYAVNGSGSFYISLDLGLTWEWKLENIPELKDDLLVTGLDLPFFTLFCSEDIIITQLPRIEPRDTRRLYFDLNNRRH